jgi:hypothetical protein
VSANEPPAAFLMPSFAEFQAMTPDEFVCFWELWAQAFSPTQTQLRDIRIAVDLRRDGWTIKSKGPDFSPPAWFRWSHPKKHHSTLKPEVAHELNARGWLTESGRKFMVANEGGRRRIM